MPKALHLQEAQELRLAGKFQEAISKLEDFWATLGENQHLEQICCLNEWSSCLIHLSQLDEAENRALDALKLAEEFAPDTGDQARTLFYIGMISWQRGDLSKAREFFRHSLIMGERIGDLERLASSLGCLGVISYQEGELDQAEEFHLRSLALREKIGNLKDVAGSLSNLGQVCRQKGDLDQAEEYHQRSLALREQLGNLIDISASLNNLGNVYREKGELDRAEELYQQSLDLQMKEGNPYHIATVQNNLGQILWERRELARAGHLLKQSLALFQEVGSAQDQAEPCFQLIRVQLLRGELEEAIALINQLSQLTQLTKLPDVAVKHFLAQSWINLKQDELQLALASASHAKTVASEIPHFELQVEAMHLLLQIYVKMVFQTRDVSHLAAIHPLLEELAELSLRESLHSTQIETMIAQGIIETAFFDFSRAENLLKSAQRVALKRGMSLLAQRSSFELERLAEQKKILQKLEKQAQLHQKEQVQKFKLQDLFLQKRDEYLAVAQKIVSDNLIHLVEQISDSSLPPD